MEEICRTILSKYVRSDSVLRCLELAGYTTSHVIRCLDINQLNEVETFVRHACSRMPEESRSEYVGDLFALEPSEFRFPGGIRCGLLLGVEELRRELTSETNGRSSPLVITKETRNQVCQTDSSPYKLESSLFEDRRRTIPTTHYPNFNGNHLASSLVALQKQADSIMPPTSPAESSSTGSKTSIPPLQLTSNKYDPVNVEHLKHHATASIIRLASRQFVNGALIKERDFDMNIELVATSDGQYRATGIFYCHLCRKKRERSSAVRFSIARNRYPVVSNVMSHLKSHFMYITPPGVTPVSNPMNLSSWPGVSTPVSITQQLQLHPGNVKQEMVFPSFLSPGSQSPLDFSSLPLNCSVISADYPLGLPNEHESDDVEEQDDDLPPEVSSNKHSARIASPSFVASAVSQHSI